MLSNYFITIIIKITIKICYLWPDHQCRSQRSDCRTIRLHHTPHTHPSPSQNAAHHHSQTAGQRQTPHLKRWHKIASVLWHVESHLVISTWHFPLRQAAVGPKGGERSDSQRVPSTNWEPRLTMKSSPSDWHMYRHCSSPKYDEKS